MALDPVLAAGVKPVQFENPMNALTQMMQIRAQQGQFDQQQRATEEQNKLRDYFANNDQKSPDFVRGLYGVSPTQAMAFEEKQLTARKNQAEIDAKSFDLATKREQNYKSTLAALHDRPDLSKPMAVAVMQSKLNEGLITPQMFQFVTSDLPDDPNALREQLRQGLKEQLTPEQKLTLFAPKPVEQNDGQIKRTIDNNPLSPTYGKPTGAPALQMLPTPEAVLTDERQRSEGRLNRGVQIRGQDLTDSRQRELNTITKEQKPLTEGQAKSALFGTRMAMANKIFDTLEVSGTTTSNPGMNSGYGIGSVVSAMSSADQQQLMQAKRDFLNAILRRESGAVIGESEFESGNKQYFPQIGDDKKTIAQKKANREAAVRGVLIDVPENRRAEIVREISGDAPAGMPDMSAIDAEIARRAKGGK